MSGTMRIRFAPDMPMAAVEVLSPDLQTVKRLSVRPGGEEQVEVPSERSFIRLHLPSGRIVTLRHEGNLSYDISRSALEGGRGRPLIPSPRRPPINVREVRGYHSVRSAANQVSKTTRGTAFPMEMFGIEAPSPPTATPQVTLPDSIRAEWEPHASGRASLDGRELAYSPPVQGRPYTLRVWVGETQLVVSLPGRLDATYVRVDEVGEGGRLVSVRVSTTSKDADTVGAYLTRGDYYAAETMASWADEAVEMLREKMENPYAATVGAYLLLRLERFDLMRDWAHNLATGFPFLSDGCVIWAWQNIRQRNNPEAATQYLLQAVTNGLPVYTEGLRLLSEGLRLIGLPGKQALENLNRMSGPVVWNSPFTARLEGTPLSTGITTTFDVDYMTAI